MNLIIGSHVSFSKDGLLGSAMEATGYGANTFMLYTGAPQNTNRKEIDKNIVEKAHKYMIEHNIDSKNVIVHAPYIINPANTLNIDFATNFLIQEIKRTKELGLTKIVLHPGSHVGLGLDTGIKNIVTVLKQVMEYNDGIKICLETMAGKGTEIGSKFEELKQIIDGVNNKDIMVCLDTCHINDAGYDITNFNEVLTTFDKIIGLDKLGCIHINDSKNEINTHKDRHENFGYGTIGYDTLISIIYNEKLSNIFKILETTYLTENDTSKERAFPPYKFEIEMIKNKKFNSNLIEEIRAYYK